jgi:site-specific DNA-methyltransferase (adenine-specific)
VTGSRFDGLARAHPRPEPLDRREGLVRSFTCAGALVPDPFGGVGSVPVACARLGRPFAGIEATRGTCGSPAGG